MRFARMRGAQICIETYSLCGRCPPKTRWKFRWPPRFFGRSYAPGQLDTYAPQAQISIYREVYVYGEVCVCTYFAGID